jgi:hypothetical protein
MANNLSETAEQLGFTWHYSDKTTQLVNLISLRSGKICCWGLSKREALRWLEQFKAGIERVAQSKEQQR